MKTEAPKSTEKRIVTNSSDRQENHRPDFKTCPHCDQMFEMEEWDRAAVTLILEPLCYRASSVAVMSECPKCFKPSWVHHRMGGFSWGFDWPKGWSDAVKKRENALNVTVYRNWASGLCGRCIHLESGSSEGHAWRTCKRGTGPVEKTCAQFEEAKT